MAYALTTCAPGASNLTAKNRVWDFFDSPNKTRPANRRQPQQPRRENRPTTTKPASGIPYWPSRDPIGERGGVNLYGFVENDGINYLDYLGLDVLINAQSITINPGAASRKQFFAVISQDGDTTIDEVTGDGGKPITSEPTRTDITPEKREPEDFPEVPGAPRSYQFRSPSNEDRYGKGIELIVKGKEKGCSFTMKISVLDFVTVDEITYCKEIPALKSAPTLHVSPSRVTSTSEQLEIDPESKSTNTIQKCEKHK